MHYKSRLLAVLIAAGSTSFAMASDGTITFNGEVRAETCVVKVNGGNSSPTVILPAVAAKTLGAKGQVAGLTGFTMELSECGAASKKVYAYFETGSSVDSGSGNLKNVSGTAKGVQLQLVDTSNASASNAIKAGQESQRSATTKIDTASGAALLPYGVQYFADGVVSAGTVISSVTYSIAYP